MIRYTLRCQRDHAFESWFGDAAAYDALAKAGHLSCPECGSTSVSKALMAPAVVTRRGRSGTVAKLPEQPAPAASVDVHPVVSTDDKHQAMRMLLREMRDHVMQHARDVGAEFASEARKMHEGAVEQASIRGIASPDEVRSLLDDGIEVAPLPVFPDERN